MENTIESNHFELNEYKEKYNILLEKVKNDNYLSDKEKELFFSELNNQTNPSIIDFIINNYDEVIKWLKLKWELIKLINDLEKISIDLDNAKTKSRKVIALHEEKISNLDKINAEDNINFI